MQSAYKLDLLLFSVLPLVNFILMSIKKMRELLTKQNKAKTHLLAWKLDSYRSENLYIALFETGISGTEVRVLPT